MIVRIFRGSAAIVLVLSACCLCAVAAETINSGLYIMAGVLLVLAIEIGRAALKKSPHEPTGHTMTAPRPQPSGGALRCQLPKGWQLFDNSGDYT